MHARMFTTAAAGAAAACRSGSDVQGPLERVTFGASSEDRARLARDGWPRYVDWALARAREPDPAASKAVANATLKIAYAAGEGYAALEEDRPLRSLSAPLAEVWPITQWDKPMAWEERYRPLEELRVATIIRAIAADAQLLEVIVDFWRDHFSINGDADTAIVAALPAFDRDVLRAHALGNFREMLEAVARSTAMLTYLDNASSRASPANENYARELFELHTLGADAYLNHLYNRWRDVPGAAEGRPHGFIDQDVYEAARAFTGWTVANGGWVRDEEVLPNTGAFHYCAAYHDPYQKRVLGIELEPNAPPLADGRKVLDLTAFHSATARHLAEKLCRRFVADDPPRSLVDRVAQRFSETARKPTQIAETLSVLLRSPELAAAPPRPKRPLAMIASLHRRTGIPYTSDANHHWLLVQMGQHLYGWPTPAGHPDRDAYWLSPGFFIRRWQTLQAWATVLLQAEPQASWDGPSSFLADWAARLYGDPPSEVWPPVHDALVAQCPPGTALSAADQNQAFVLSQTIAALAAAPAFQLG